MYNNSNNNNQSSGLNNPLQNFRFSQQPEMKPLRQIELEARLGQLKSQANDNSNPYYDNSYRNNRDIYRENNNNYSNNNNEQKSFTPVQSQRPQVERNEDVAAGQNQRKNYAAPADQNAGRGFFDNFGDNQRHNKIQNDLRTYVRKLGGQDYQPSEIGGFYKNQEVTNNGRDRSNGRGRRGQNQSSNNQKEDWYVQNYNVGILPGMGKPEDGGRSSVARQKTFEVSPMQERYNNDQTRGSERAPQNPRDDVGSARLGGRNQLANAGSRIVDGDDYRGFGSRLDQIKAPESYGDYGNLDQRKDIYSNVQYSKSPQFRDLLQNYQKPIEQDFGYGNRAGSVNDLRDWKANAVTKQPSMMMQNETSEFNIPKRNIPEFSAAPSSKVNNNNNNNDEKAGTNWLKQRESEEVDKKQKQREELQRVYQEQVEEKKRKKEEEKRRQWLEDQKEEERLRKENEEIQRQFALEVQKKKEQELAKENEQLKLKEVVEDFAAAANKRKQNKFNKAFENSEETSMRRETLTVNVMKQEEIEPEREMMRYDPPARRLEDLVKETAKFVENENRFKQRVELSRDPELEVHKAVMRRIDATLDEQLDKMKKDLSAHTQLIRESQATYKHQALVASELRQNAQKDLLRLREDLRMQQVEEETRPFQNFNFTPSNAQEMKQTASTKQLMSQNKAQEKPGLRLGTKNYSNSNKMQPIQSYDNHYDDVDLGAGTSRLGMTLDVDTHYVPVKGLGDLSLETSRAENKYALDSKDEMVGYGDDDDAAKNKFDSLFPAYKQGHDNNYSNKDAHIEHNYRAAIKEVKNGGGVELNEHRFNYMKGPTQVRQYEKVQPRNASKKDDFGDVEGADEIERLDNLLKRYKEQARHQDDDYDHMELAQVTEKKPVMQQQQQQQPSQNRINTQPKFDDSGDYELPDREEAHNHLGGNLHQEVEA